MSKRTEYECRVCGYEPDFNELNQGSCPHCQEEQRQSGPIELQQIRSLPVGGTVDVCTQHIIYPQCENRYQNERSTDPNCKTWWTTQTRARFRCVSIDSMGTRQFLALREIIEHEARDCYEECQPGTGTKRVIRQWTGTPYNRAESAVDLWTAENVHNWFGSERTYGAWLVVKDNIPTDRDLSRQRLCEGVGLE